MFEKFVKKIRLLQKENTLAFLRGKISGSVWAKAQESLLDYNKSIITLSSSALILSFSLIKITETSLNKWLVGLSWAFFLITILLGVLILFIKFLYDIADGLLEKGAKAGKYKKKESILKYKEIMIYFKYRGTIFWLAVFELLFFWIAFLLLIITAFHSL